jgi:protoporphyrinogen/coproporphyrinogen III oxidase
MHAQNHPAAPKRTLVVGGGIAGLAAAHDLKRAGCAVEVWEAAEQPGGVVRSLRLGDFLFELGPNSVPPSARNLLDLVAELGLTSELIYSSPQARRRYLFLKGGLVALPNNPLELLRTPVLSAAGKIRLLSERLRRFEAPPTGAAEPSFHALVEERFGREAAERLAGAFVRGVYAGDARQLGARSAFPRVWGLLVQHGSILAGLAALARERRTQNPRQTRAERRSAQALVSLRHGFGQLVEALARSLGTNLVLGRAALGIERTAGAGQPLYRVRSGCGDVGEFDQVLLAAPAPVAARLLAAIAPRAARELASVRHAAVHTVHLGLLRSEFGSPEASRLPAGFGFLVPPAEVGDEAPRALGTLFPSQIFGGRAPAEQVAVSLFYSAATLAQAGCSPAEVAGEDLRRALQLPRAPQALVSHDVAWPQGIAQAEIGHGERVERARGSLQLEAPGVQLAGGHVGGVSVEDTLRSGREAVRHWLAAAPREPG